MKKGSDKPRILIVDDDKNTRDGLERAFRRSYDISLAESAERALTMLEGAEFDILLSDVRMPGMDGLKLIQRARGMVPGLVCILITAYGNVETAVEAMKVGAYDFLTKPINLDHLELLLKRSLRSREMESENAALREELDERYGLESIVGNSPVMLDLFDVIKQAAPTQATVVVQGESGTGKELVAHAVHRLSTRSDGPFVAVHCAALSSNLLESELFGHEKGAFTGATGRKRGRFELADGGTLFLDEISEIDEAVQVKLLRVLEERQFERVGGTETVEVDIRLITSTNKDLKKMVDEGKFREDLFFRLDVVNIDLPPLRERLDDIPLLCSNFIEDFNEKNAKAIEGVQADAIDVLAAYDWPGNVRELRNAVEKMAVMTRSKRLTARDVPQNIARGADSTTRTASAPGHVESTGSKDSLASAEKTMIFAALKKHNDNRTKAAKDLGISRRTLHRKLNKYNVPDS